MSGALVLVGTPIGNLEDLSARAVATFRSADVICCEDTRHTGKLLQHAGVSATRLVSLHAHNESERIGELLALFDEDKTVVLVSDAGMPLVSDPGERLVGAAIAHGVSVSVVPGPSAGIAALVLSGFSTARWRFEGFLPRKGADRTSRLKEVAAAPCPSVIYESPHRVRATLSDLVEICGSERMVAVARELTKLYEQVVRVPLGLSVDHEAVVAARGEFVLVVEGAPPPVAGGDEELHAALVSLFEAGLRPHDAVSAVEVFLGVSHRRAYEASLAIKAAHPDPEGLAAASKPSKRTRS